MSRERQAGFKELLEIDLRVPLFEVQPVALALSMREAEATFNKRVLGPEASPSPPKCRSCRHSSFARGERHA